MSCRIYGRKENCLQNFGEGKSEGEMPLGTLRRRFEEYIGIDIGYNDVECIYLDQHKNRWFGSSQHCTETSGSLTCREVLD
jgi:hypothetical protein